MRPASALLVSLCLAVTLVAPLRAQRRSRGVSTRVLQRDLETERGRTDILSARLKGLDSRLQAIEAAGQQAETRFAAAERANRRLQSQVTALQTALQQVRFHLWLAAGGAVALALALFWLGRRPRAGGEWSLALQQAQSAGERLRSAEAHLEAIAPRAELAGGIVAHKAREQAAK